MRISTGMIFAAGVSSVGKQSATLLGLQQQISSGRRLLAPSDDPVAAARALEMTQAQDLIQQYGANQIHASSALGLEESQLANASALLAQARQLAIQGGSGSLTHPDRLAVTAQLRSVFEQMLAVANATDGTGEHLFAGYMSATRPFAGTVAGGVTYFGDDGRRALQVSASQQLAVSDSGNAVFNRIASGNGHFATSYAAVNAGSGVVDGGSVSDAAKWGSAANSGNLKISFWVDAAGDLGEAGVTYYDLVDAADGTSLLTGEASATGAGGSHTRAYRSGEAIRFADLDAAYGDFGAQVTITGEPASGDSFSIKASSSQSVFETLRGLITALERPPAAGAAHAARLANDIGSALTNIAAAEQNILTVRASIGARLNAVESIRSVNEGVGAQVQQALSQLQDVDYTKAISDLAQTQMQLEAAQKSFLKVSQLSLFNYV